MHSFEQQIDLHTLSHRRQMSLNFASFLVYYSGQLVHKHGSFDIYLHFMCSWNCVIEIEQGWYV